MIAESHSTVKLARRRVLNGLAIAFVGPVLPAYAGGGSAAKAFIADIYRRYVGSSAGSAKGISLNSVKTVRSYFTFGLASLIIEDRAAAVRGGEPPVLESDPFIGRQDWSLSKSHHRGEGQGDDGDRHCIVHEFRQA